MKSVGLNESVLTVGCRNCSIHADISQGHRLHVLMIGCSNQKTFDIGEYCHEGFTGRCRVTSQVIEGALKDNDGFHTNGCFSFFSKN